MGAIRRLGILLVGGIGLLGLLAPLAASAQAGADRIGRVVDVGGNVWIWDRQANSWQGIDPRLAIVRGDRLATDGGGRVELRFGSTSLRVGGGSEVEMLQLDDQTLRAQLHRGAMTLRLTNDATATATEIVTDEGLMLPLRSGLYRFDRNDDAVTFAGVWRGEMEFRGHQNVRLIGPDERIGIWRDAATGHARTRLSLLPSDAMTRWALAGDTPPAPPPAPLPDTREPPPPMADLDQLDRYGVWEPHPEYGSVWVPYAPPAGWDPYRDRLWLERAPWGRAPLHHGRWVSWRGRWTWWPGARSGISIGIGGGAPPRWQAPAPLPPVIVLPAPRPPIYIDRDDRHGDRHRGRDRDHGRRPDRDGDRHRSIDPDRRSGTPPPMFEQGGRGRPARPEVPEPRRTVRPPEGRQTGPGPGVDDRHGRPPREQREQRDERRQLPERPQRREQML